MDCGGQVGGGQKGVGRMVEGAGRRTEEKDWRTGGYRSWTELTFGRAGNWPSHVVVRKLSDSV